MRTTLRGLVFGLALLLSSSVLAASEVYTTVTKAEIPLYPPLARAALVQGIVVAEVTTSGEAFGAIKIVSGHPLLSAAVTENLRTWALVNSPTMTFSLTYRYKIADSCKGKPSVVMELPTKVSICSPPNPLTY
jgi:hypothetical protein